MYGLILFDSFLAGADTELDYERYRIQMGFLVATFLFFIALMLRYTQKSWASPAVLFSLEWAVICFLSSLQLYGMYGVSDYTWFIIFVGSMSFLVGTGLGRNIRVKKSFICTNSDDDCLIRQPFISVKMFWLFMVILLIYSSFDFFQSMVLLQAGFTLDEIRAASVGNLEIEGFVYKIGALADTLRLVFSVIELIVVAAGIYYFVTDARKNYKLIVAVLILELMKSFSNGGRFNLAYMVVELVVCMILYKKIYRSSGKAFSKKTMKIIKFVVLFLAVTIVFITLLRRTQINELEKKYYKYICGNTVFFDLHVQRLRGADFLSLGYASLWGLWNFFFPFFHTLGFPHPQLYLSTGENIMDTQTFLQIGNDMSTNAFITPFYHLYADFRIPGVILGMVSFGIIAGYYYKKAIVNKDSYSIICYLIISQMIFKSLQHYPFTNSTYFFGMVVLLILGRSRRLGYQRRNFDRR